MTHVTITPNLEKKRLRFVGDEIAAGEHVVVTVAGFADKIDSGNLRLRVLSCDRLVAMFPYVQADSWTAAESDAECVLNLNSVELREATRCGGCEFSFILDDVSVPQKYGEGRKFIGEWRKEPGADEPYVLDGYPDVIREFGERLDAFGADVAAAKTAAEAAGASATNAANAATSAGQSAAQSLAAVNASAESARTAEAAASAAETAVEAVKGSVEAAQTAAAASESKASLAAAKATEAAASAAEAVAAVSEKADKTEFDAHVEDADNPHNVTKKQVGLGSVDNVADRYKPVSEAQRAAINEEKYRAIEKETLLHEEIAALKAKFDFSTISALEDADSIRAVKNAFNNLLQILKAVNP